VGNQPGIVFLNFKDSIERVSQYLQSKGIEHGCFHGGRDQKDREQALIKFRNGTNRLILATDLASRGLDIPEISFIIHYHLPNRPEEFTHRNGRTARVSREGTAYVLTSSAEHLPDFIGDIKSKKLLIKPIPSPSEWSTLFISGGRRDKISKGDIVGFLIKEGHISSESIGQIELKQDCAFIAVHKSLINQLISRLNQKKLKKRKLNIYQV
jgi:superfamily II DNA/RNA helicase